MKAGAAKPASGGKGKKKTVGGYPSVEKKNDEALEDGEIAPAPKPVLEASAEARGSAFDAEVYEKSLEGLEVDQLARISATLGYKAVITGKAAIEKLRSKEDDLLRVSSDIALKKELSRLKEENTSLEKIRKLRKEEVADLKKKTRDLWKEAAEKLQAQSVEMEKNVLDNQSILEKLHDTIEKDVNTINALSKEKKELIATAEEREAVIQKLAKNLEDQNTFITEAENVLKERFRAIHESYTRALGEFGAEPLEFPKDQGDKEMFDWMEQEFDSLPSVMTSASDYVASLCTENLLKLLESNGCSDFLPMGARSFDFPEASEFEKVKPSKNVAVVKRNFLALFWEAYGQEHAKAIARRLLAEAKEKESSQH
ncbi:hypothetical protein PVAP13_4KG268110 [Panicum virgatum]|uniref:Uncharacterized protein n=1 Tax=Panicum virgatum TaxID=38727 RepID=A0A8T0TTX0_PANVG|nr:hypothetical protein PVAP13_4KG268110 [Panicum virgatum]